MRLTTERLELAPLDWATAAAVVAGDRASCWARGYPTDGDVLVAGLVLAGWGLAEPGPFTHYTLTRRDTGELIGGVGLHHPPDARGETEIGYGIAAEHRRQGLVTEAVGALVEALPAEATSVLARLEGPNLASSRVLRKAGFSEVEPGLFRLSRCR